MLENIVYEVTMTPKVSEDKFFHGPASGTW